MNELWAEYGKLARRLHELQHETGVVVNELNKVWAQINTVKPEEKNGKGKKGNTNMD